MQAAKQAGKKLGRPKGGKIKGEDEVMYYYLKMIHLGAEYREYTDIKYYKDLSELAGVSKATVQRIINKHKNKND